MTAPATEQLVIVITPAQDRVLRELCRDGATDPVIADRLNLSIDTVKSHLRALFAAAGVSTRTALVVLLLRGQARVRVDTQRARRAPVTSGATLGA